jgi:hypothetical protein
MDSNKPTIRLVSSQENPVRTSSDPTYKLHVVPELGQESITPLPPLPPEFNIMSLPPDIRKQITKQCAEQDRSERYILLSLLRIGITAVDQNRIGIDNDNL